MSVSTKQLSGGKRAPEPRSSLLRPLRWPRTGRPPCRRSPPWPGSAAPRCTATSPTARRSIYEATLDSIRVLTEAVDEAATDDGPALDAMRRFITAAVSIGERLVFLFGDPAVLRDIPPAQSPNEELVINLITRGQHEGVFDPDLDPTWIWHALYALILRGCEQAIAGALPRHTVAPLITRTFERGVSPAP